jgi:hypothetical protein
MNDFSDLDEKTPVQLGLEGYCYLALYLLVKIYPESKIYRLTTGNDFGHATVNKYYFHFNHF